MLRALCLTPCVVLTLLTTGCSPSQGDIEKSIRDEMKSKMNVEIKTFDLKKQADGSYLGTATADNGDVYDITTEAPQGNKISWKATPSKTTIERMIKEMVAAQLKLKVTSITLEKKEGMDYAGHATTEQGVTLDLSAKWTGNDYQLQAVPAIK
jgi:hypothetical protein